MISFLRGNKVEIDPAKVIMDVNGVGLKVQGFAMIDLPASINERPPPVVPGLPAILPVRVTSDTERNTSSTTRAAVLMGKLLAMLGFDTQLLHSSHVSSGKS